MQGAPCFYAGIAFPASLFTHYLVWMAQYRLCRVRDWAVVRER